jgi:protoheme IX farnesyltransferase
VYTPLKYRTIWAIIPGALCGAIPPYIGWLAAGGEPVSALIGAAAMLLALWQIPHFLLIMLKHKADYRSSVLPSFIDCAPDSSLRLLIVVWTSACVARCSCHLDAVGRQRNTLMVADKCNEPDLSRRILGEAV